MDPRMPTFRRRKNGSWAVVGPDDAVVEGESVTVARKDGTTTTVHIDAVSDAFFEDGMRKRWGYFLEKPKPQTGTLF